MNDKNNLEGYNPLRNNRRNAFNSDYGRSVFTENASQVTDEQRKQAAQRLQDLIIKCHSDLTDDNL